MPCFTQDTMSSQQLPLSSSPQSRHLHLSHTTHTQLTHTYTHKHAHNPDTHPLITHRLLPSLCSRGLMGNLLKVLACAELEHGPIVFLDFERETIRFLFFWVIPFSLLPLLCFLHTIDLSWPLCHLYIFIYLSLPPQLFSSSPTSLSLISAPGTGIWKSFGIFSKGSYSHTPHLIRCRQMHNGMVTLKQNDNNNALISSPRLQKLRRNKLNVSPVWVSVTQGWWWLTKSISSSLHLLISSSPIVSTFVCQTNLCVCVCVCITRNNACVRD